jgi:hypothetical protein
VSLCFSVIEFCHGICYAVMLNVVMLSVIMLIIIMLSVTMLSLILIY